ncbi:MAG: glutathione peroxidase [Flavobacteriales bacterium]|tara:strand:+ start:596 stop:1075 length:480 start_codon:yes stop_codon:yes gene_type:complete
MDFYTQEINTPQGTTIKMNDFKGKVVLIVNTATQCGLTPQFDGLEKLHQAYKDKNLVILGTPCNQFGGQEPLSNETMSETCRINHGVTFQLTEKIDVNGSKTHPLYVYLKAKLGTILGKSIKWNFAKFLIDQAGNPVKRFSPTTKPEKIEKYIKNLLSL